jgi:lipopolysaccharide export system permease protein
VVVAYYVMNVACEFLVTAIVIPPFAGAWLPNFVFLIITLLWFYRMSKQ